MRSKFKTLGKTTVRVKAVGRYPTKSRTPVQDVAHYQNDGTSRGVTPARFVERAESSAGNWEEEIDEAIESTIDGNEAALQVLGTQIADDIGDMCDRIRTGKLKKSFRREIK
jgi:hypothetical protein